MAPRRILLFICSVFLLLVICCLIFPDDGIQIGDKSIDFPSLTAVLTKDTTSSESAASMIDRSNQELELVINEDSLREVRLVEDSINAYKKIFESSSAKIYFPTSSPSFLYPLFEAIESAQDTGEVIHILHYGDSQIEQDRITADIREDLQAAFGGWGPGLVPAVQPIPSISVGQTVSPELPRYIIEGTMEQKCSHNRYGILGQVAQVDSMVTLGIGARNWDTTKPHVKKFSKVTLLVGNTSEHFIARLTCSGMDSEQIIEEPKPGMTALVWDLKYPVSRFSLYLEGQAEIYGISMDGKSGVSVDNIGMRGAGGYFFTSIDKTLMASSIKSMNTKLIILEFGGNVVPYIHNQRQISKYVKAMSKQIRYLQSCDSTVQILFIGPSDMSTKVKGTLQTYPILAELIDSLKCTALKNGAMFWNMYDAMGGHNSMIQWVSSSPALAGSDYTHFTTEGAKQISDLFVKSLMKYYEFYLFERRHKDDER